MSPPREALDAEVASISTTVTTTNIQMWVTKT